MKRSVVALGCVLLTAALTAGCPAPPPPSAPPPGPQVEPPPSPEPPPPTQLAKDGSECTVGADCDSGICEGQGCDTAGVCMSRARACTRDLVSYCGCDGRTFQSSGSCPGKRYSARGECKAQAAKPDGAACSIGTDCQSGLCEGQGCGDQNGVCVSRKRRCTMDLRPYCGCDNQTFRTSGSCPGRRFAHRGECKSP